MKTVRSHARSIVVTALVCPILTGCGYLAIGGALGVTALTGKNKSVTPTPEPVFVFTPAKVQTDRVALSYTLTGSQSNFDIRVEYSTNGTGGPFVTATEALGSPSEGTQALSVNAKGAAHVSCGTLSSTLTRRTSRTPRASRCGSRL